MGKLGWIVAGVLAVALIGVVASGSGKSHRPRAHASATKTDNAVSAGTRKAIKDSTTDSDGDGVLDAYDADPDDAAIRTAEDTTATPTPAPTATPKPHKPRIGDHLSLDGNDAGEQLRVKVLRVIDPVETGEFDEADSGKRFVGVEVRLTNTGSTTYDDSTSNSATLIYSGDRQADATLVSDGECSGDFDQVKIRPGGRRTGCIPFEVPVGKRPRLFQFVLDSGFADEVGEWRLH
jgi:Domain of unknown function (DUF4352)